MPPRKPVKTDAATFSKMLADHGYAYKHLYETYKTNFHHYFKDHNLANKGYLEADLFQEFCTAKSTSKILKSYSPAKGLFSTWINKIMDNFCIDIAKKHTIDEQLEHYDDPDNSFQLEDIIDEGVDYTYANDLLISILATIKNDDLRTILEDFLIYGLDKEETIKKLGIDSATYSTYKGRAIEVCSDKLYDMGLIDDAQRKYIQKTRRRSQPADTRFLECLAPGFMSNFEVVPMSGDRDMDWIMMKLRSINNQNAI